METKLKWIIDVNSRAKKKIQLLKENIEINPCELGLASAFLAKTPKEQKKM